MDPTDGLTVIDLPPTHTSLFCASLPTGLSTCSLLSRPHHIRAVDGSLHLTARPTAGGGGGGRAGRGRAVLGDGAQCAEARLRATIACGGLSRLVSVRSAIGTGWLYTGPGGAQVSQGTRGVGSGAKGETSYAITARFAKPGWCRRSTTRYRHRAMAMSSQPSRDGGAPHLAPTCNPRRDARMVRLLTQSRETSSAQRCVHGEPATLWG